MGTLNSVEGTSQRERGEAAGSSRSAGGQSGSFGAAHRWEHRSGCRERSGGRGGAGREPRADVSYALGDAQGEGGHRGRGQSSSARRARDTASRSSHRRT